MSYTSRRVLSIQSQVVHGYVGNSCATFPLQLLGFDVCAINSVQFSNHKGYAAVIREDEPMSKLTDGTGLTGYTHCTGQVFTADHVQDLYDGLKANSINSFSHILSGYIGNPTFLEKVCDVIADVKRTNPGVTYLCDPVMGDNGHMYVPKELLPIYQNRVLPLADVIVPNQYEAELLTGCKIRTEPEMVAAMNKLHAKGVKTVIISSSDLGDDTVLLALASTLDGKKQTIHRILIPKLRGLFVGTGDLFAALMLAWMETDKDLQIALEKTISTLQKVIRRTVQASLDLCDKESRDKPTAAQMELQLVQSKTDIESPLVLIKAERVQVHNSPDSTCS